MSENEIQYALCNSCGKLFKSEVLKLIPVAGMPARAKICKGCLEAADERSTL